MKPIAKKLLLLFLFVSSFIGQNYAMEETQIKTKNGFPGIKKINDELYVGKIADDFYLAMEKINLNEVPMWLDYINNQIQFGERMNLTYLPTLDGSQNFKLVLNAYRSGEIKPNNELWIAYASTVPVTTKAILSNKKNPNIEMYVTVATSPEALLTSHMGISRTWENAYYLQQEPPKRKKHPYQSLHLHSFAAKVMKMRDPRKVYMLTAPTIAMKNILVSKMPKNSIFIGDSLYKEKVENASKDPLTLLTQCDLKPRKRESAQERENRLKTAAERMYDYYKIKDQLQLLQTNPPRIIRTRESNNQQFVILNLDKTPLVTFDQSSPIYQWIFTEPYTDSGLKLPYVLIDLEQLAGFDTLVKQD